jgi:hypothetical protein
MLFVMCICQCLLVVMHYDSECELSGVSQFSPSSWSITILCVQRNRLSISLSEDLMEAYPRTATGWTSTLIYAETHLMIEKLAHKRNY